MGKKKIIVTGASGFLGFNFITHVVDKYTVVGVYHSHKVELPRATSQPLQIINTRDVDNMVDNIRPDIIFHLASVSNPNQCEKNPGASYGTNVRGTKNIVAAAKSIGAKVVFTSSDLVFDGNEAPYSEEDTPHPVNRYGEQKAEAEQAVLEYQHGVVIRLPLMFGPKSPHSGSFLQPTVNFLRANSPVTLFEDEYRTPISSRKAIEGLLLAAGSDTSLIHFSCGEKISRYELGLRICDYLNLDKSLLVKSKQDEVEFPANRPRDTSLDIRKAQSLGFNPGSLDEEIKWVLEYI
ncbi:MAG: NAD(P)-dependent oxidoreductase [Bacteroidales bacterium]|nr:NAD(P)-dependent oxidoreductase [Bacteroidales bacterium]MCF8334477.1 NAD(P)-dependent oxidoreductase [Bacteroidales bacterium]